MTNIDIKISINRLSDYSASLRSTVEEDTLLLMMESFSKYVLELYGSLIEDAINSKRYKGKWEPVDEEGYKEYIGTEPIGNIILLIKDALEVQKVGYNFLIRINPRYRYPGSKLTLLRVLRAIEEGTSDFNARPILAKSVRNIRTHIIELWKGYLAIKNIL